MLTMKMEAPFTKRRTVIEGDMRVDIAAEFMCAEERGLTTDLHETSREMPLLSLRLHGYRRDKLGMWRDEDPPRARDFSDPEIAELHTLACRWSGNHMRPGTTKQAALISVTEMNRGRPLRYEDEVELLKLNGAYEQEIPGRAGDGYRYGHAWLVEPLPIEVSSRIIEILDKPSDDVRSIADTNTARWLELGLMLWTRRIPKRTDRDQTDDWDKDAKHYLCKLSKDDETVEIEFSQGSAHKEPPTLPELMECLREDVRVGPEWDRGFEDWCANYGYEEDSRKAERIYAHCVELREKMLRLLGEELFEAWEQGE